mmetsp:Transcript_27092/g.79303  ORF Transcript_27092/g.79303 Transcript_27092/m.79303 type:complete len:81 (+) Transcript_27092:225-467(+)
MRVLFRDDKTPLDYEPAGIDKAPAYDLSRARRGRSQRSVTRGGGPAQSARTCAHAHGLPQRLLCSAGRKGVRVRGERKQE